MKNNVASPTLLVLSFVCMVSGIFSRSYGQKASEAWVAHYSKVSPFSLAGFDVDPEGNTSLAGGEITINTVRYNTSGIEQWVSNYQTNGFGYANDVAVDANGNTVVIGSEGAFENYPVVFKYDSLGVLQWSLPAAGLEGSDSYGVAIDVDTVGNIYRVVNYNSTLEGSGGTEYALTSKLDTHGQIIWGPVWESGMIPIDLAVDNAGNVYLIGTTWAPSNAPTDYVTRKYDANGTLQWAQTYDGPGSSDDYPRAVAVDDSGNVYVTGWTYNSTTGGGDFATVKYNAQGIQQWVALYDGPGQGPDGAVDLGIDASGSVYVTGTATVSFSQSDFVTIKYNPEGIQQWVARFGAQEGRTGEARDLVIDDGDNIYVTGTSYGPGGDYTTIKYDSTGEMQWVAFYNGAANGDDFAIAVDVDGSGGLYVTGESQEGTGSAYTTIKYVQHPDATSLVSPSHGAVVTADSVALVWFAQNMSKVDRYWLEVDTDSLFSSSFVDSLVVDTTYTLPSLNHQTTYWWRVRAHNAYGWGSFSEPRSFFAFQEIPAPPILVAPTNGETGVALDPLIDWISSLGAETYAFQLSDTADFSTLVLDEDSLTETSFHAMELSGLTTYMWRVSATNALGTSNWSESWSFQTVIGTPPSQVILASPENGSLVIVGDISVVCYWHQGLPGIDSYWFEWASDSMFTDSRIDSTINDTLSIASPLGNGETYWWKVRAHNNYGWGPFSETWSFSVIITDIDLEDAVPTKYSLSQNYPNPFNPSTEIRYGLPSQAHVSLEVFNMLGQRVASLVDEVQDPGYHEVTFDRAALSSGLYIYRLTAGNFMQTRKLILLK